MHQTQMPLQADASLHAMPGDFAAVIDTQSGVLKVPADIMAVAVKYRVDTLASFIGYADAFPTTCAAELGWTPQEVQCAAGKLEQEMIQANILPRRSAPPKRVYGLG